VNRPTEMANVADVSLSELFKIQDSDEVVEAATRTALEQIEKPRYNLGGAGPPGRAD
jgi:hypothetical protein